MLLLVLLFATVVAVVAHVVVALSDPCMNSPCVNGGTCKFEDEDYECTCAPGWSGFECQCKYNLHNILMDRSNPKNTIT